MTSNVEARFEPQVLARARWHLDEVWYRPIRSRRTTREATFWRALDATKTFELDGIQVDVRSLGRGPAVLLVHGVGGRGSQFMALMRALAAAGLCAVSLDLPGSGRQRLERVGVNALARVLLRIDPGHPDGWCGIVTHSMGNLWVLYAATRGLACARYVAVSGVFEAELGHRLYREIHHLSQNDMDCLHALRCESEGELAMRDQDPAQVLHSYCLGHRALIVQASDDEVVPVAHGRHWADQWARRWSGSSYVEIAGSSHLSVLSSPQLCARVTEFLPPEAP